MKMADFSIQKSWNTISVMKLQRKDDLIYWQNRFWGARSQQASVFKRGKSTLMEKEEDIK
jgi:hypothetical protein